MIAIGDWVRARSVREQRLLAAMAVIAVPMLVWFALALPLSRAYDRALDRQLEAVDRNGRVKALAAAQHGPRVRPPAGDIVLLLGDSARSSSVEAQAQLQAPGTATVTVAAAAPSAALAWLSSLEAQGYTIRDLRVTPDGKGSVTVSATVSGAAS